MPALTKEVQWGKDNDLDAAPTLSDEERFLLKKRMDALDKLLAEQKKAKYKIELLIGSAYKTGAAYPGAVSFWESGAKLHGGGDAKLYACPGSELKVNACQGFIPDVSQGYGFLACPTCQKVWKEQDVHGEILARLTTQDWANLLYKYFVRLGHNADIYVKRSRYDIRKASELEQHAQLMGDKLIQARAKREVFIYPLRNIIKDTSAGADIVLRFRALLCA